MNDQERYDWFGKQLQSSGVTMVRNDTGPVSFGDVFPVEYQISIGNIRSGICPTLDMALVAFIEKLLPQAKDPHKELAHLERILQNMEGWSEPE